MKFRKEFDSIGSINVPRNKYWGASTQRSKKYFDIGEFLVRPILIKSIAIIKKAAAQVHKKEKQILPKISKAIIIASNEIISGKLDSHFPLKVWQTGSGTQTNMNVNEVISNRAIEILGGKKGTKKPVHPNDHVNKSQSTNDVFPTAMHIAIAIETKNKLLPSLILLNKELKKKISKFKNIVKVGRTHLQDATPLSLGQEFSGYQSQIEDCINRINNALKEIYSLAQGGTAVGTGINSKKNFDKKIINEIKKITKLPFKPTRNKFAALAAHDEIVNFSGTLNTTAVSLMKIANDIRFLGSGPRAGYGELILPANEPGSSIMPGKVNPVICESMIQSCAQVIGNDIAITLGGQGGIFELNLMLPLISHNLLQSIQILSNSIKIFTEKLIDDLKADEKKCLDYIEGSLAMCTSLAPIIGYDKAAEIAYNAYESGKTVREIALEEKVLSVEKLNELLDAKSMTKPNS